MGFVLLAALLCSLPEHNVVIHAPDGLGSGVLLSQTTVLTAAHVVAKTELAGVKCGDRYITAIVGKRDEVHDLALLGLLEQCTAVTVSSLAESAPPPGADVYAVGCPAKKCGRVMHGVVSAYEQNDGTIDMVTDIVTFYGASGGGLFDKNNKLVGIASAGGCYGADALRYCFSIYVAIGDVHGFLR